MSANFDKREIIVMLCYLSLSLPSLGRLNVNARLQINPDMAKKMFMEHKNTIKKA